MKTTSIIAAAVLLASVGAAQAATLSKNTLVPCSPAICGGFPQNDASLSLGTSSNVLVASTGRVTVTVVGLRDKVTGAIMANKSLELHYGTLQDQVARTQYLGSFTTDAFGNYKGAAMGANGQPYTFAPGQSYTGSFLVNDPAAGKTQFSTGFSVP